MVNWDDRANVLAAVAQGIFALHHASAELKADREVVMAAVAQDGRALRFAATGLKADREVVLVAVAQYGIALYDASAKLKADRDLVLAAVAQNGNALKHASAELKADREVVLAAVAQDGSALRSASAGLTADPVLRQLSRLSGTDRALPRELLRLKLYGCLQHVPAMLATGLTVEGLPAVTDGQLVGLGLGEDERAAFLAAFPQVSACLVKTCPSLPLTFASLRRC